MQLVKPNWDEISNERPCEHCTSAFIEFSINPPTPILSNFLRAIFACVNFPVFLAGCLNFHYSHRRICLDIEYQLWAPKTQTLDSTVHVSPNEGMFLFYYAKELSSISYKIFNSVEEVSCSYEGEVNCIKAKKNNWKYFVHDKSSFHATHYAPFSI